MLQESIIAKCDALVEELKDHTNAVVILVDLEGCGYDLDAVNRGGGNRFARLGLAEYYANLIRFDLVHETEESGAD